MNADMLNFVIGGSAVCLVILLFLDLIARQPRPAPIATVCMECGRHIRGPRVRKNRPVSHGLCHSCADAWRQNMLREPIRH